MSLNPGIASSFNETKTRSHTLSAAERHVLLLHRRLPRHL